MMIQELIQHFHLQEDNVKRAQNELAPGQSLLEYLFEKKWIEPSAYLLWAKDFFALPVLKEDFLSKNDQIEALTSRYKNVFPKNVIPFLEWDGVLYVMCLEPTPFQSPQPIQYILAPYETIQKYSPKVESKNIPQAPVVFHEKAELTNPLFKELKDTPSAQEPLKDFSFDKLEIPLATPASTTQESTNPVELQHETSPEKPSQDKLELAAPDGVEVSSIQDTGAPQGLSFPDLKVEAPEFVTQSNVSVAHLESLKKISPPAPESLHQEPVTKAMDLSEPKKEAITKIVDLNELKNGPETKIVDLNSLKNQPATNTAHTVSKSKENTPQAPQQFQNILELGAKYFTQFMILTYQNNVLQPSSWDATWSKQAHTQSAIDLSTPSVFRIVKETLNPYHGYIIPNSINDSFFQTWNKGVYPEHLTICPIIDKKNLVGMVLGMTTKEGAKKYQLHHIEEIAAQVLPLIQKQKAA